MVGWNLGDWAYRVAEAEQLPGGRKASSIERAAADWLLQGSTEWGWGLGAGATFRYPPLSFTQGFLLGVSGFILKSDVRRQFEIVRCFVFAMISNLNDEK